MSIIRGDSVSRRETGAGVNAGAALANVTAASTGSTAASAGLRAAADAEEVTPVEEFESEVAVSTEDEVQEEMLVEEGVRVIDGPPVRYVPTEEVGALDSSVVAVLLVVKSVYFYAFDNINANIC